MIYQRTSFLVPKHKPNICDTWVVQLLACTFIQQSQRKYEMLRGGGALKHHLCGVLANHEQVERELTPIPGWFPITMPASQRF